MVPFFNLIIYQHGLIVLYLLLNLAICALCNMICWVFQIYKWSILNLRLFYGFFFQLASALFWRYMNQQKQVIFSDRWAQIFLSVSYDRDRILDLVVRNFSVDAAPTKKLEYWQGNFYTDRKNLFLCRFISVGVFLSVYRQGNWFSNFSVGFTISVSVFVFYLSFTL